MKSFFIILLQIIFSIGIIIFTSFLGLGTYMENIWTGQYYQKTISIIPLIFNYVIVLIVYLFFLRLISLKINKNLTTTIIQIIIIITTIALLLKGFLSTINNIKTHNILFNRESIVEDLGKLFKEPKLVREVGLTKYNDFYLITSDDYLIIPYGRKLTNPKQPLERPLQSNDVRLENLKKLEGKKVNIEILATNKMPLSFVVKGLNYKDNLPIKNYYMAEISYQDYFLDMNFNICHSSISNENGDICKDKKDLYSRQDWYGTIN